jgi:hypothetical protein
MPIVIWHFGETSAWAVVANALAVPIFALWVTPWGVAAIAADGWLAADAWAPASWGAAVVLDIARVVAALPQASPIALAWAAAACLVLGAWPRLARASLWQRWAPGRITCVLVVAAAVLRPGPPSIPSASWFAFGSRREPTVLVRDEARHACAWGTAIAPERWPALLDALAVDRVTLVRRDPDARPAPHEIALHDALRAADRLGEPGACVAPDDADVRHAIAVCSRVSATPFVAADEHELRCWLGGDWHGPFDLHSRDAILR